jgi:SAM-dependent methyltransferase
MRRFLRASFLIITIVTVAGVGLRASGVWQRFKDQQFKDGEARPTGWVARTFAWAAPWAGAWIYAIFARVLDLQPEDQVLDVACGSGTFLRKHASHVRRIAGLDHSEDLIDIALRDHHERVAAGTAEFVVGDATVLPWADNQFSVVTSNCVSCFETKAQPALEEMYRVLRPGGRAAIGNDRRQMMEAIGFTQVSGRFRGIVTTGFKA